MKTTPTTIGALELAIAMLEHIARGGSYTLLNYHERLEELRAARDAHREQEMKDEQNRAAIRELRRQALAGRSA